MRLRTCRRMEAGLIKHHWWFALPGHALYRACMRSSQALSHVSRLIRGTLGCHAPPDGSCLQPESGCADLGCDQAAMR